MRKRKHSYDRIAKAKFFSSDDNGRNETAMYKKKGVVGTLDK